MPKRRRVGRLLKCDIVRSLESRDFDPIASQCPGWVHFRRVPYGPWSDKKFWPEYRCTHCAWAWDSARVNHAFKAAEERVKGARRKPEKARPRLHWEPEDDVAAVHVPNEEDMEADPTDFEDGLALL